MRNVVRNKMMQNPVFFHLRSQVVGEVGLVARKPPTHKSRLLAIFRGFENRFLRSLSHALGPDREFDEQLSQSTYANKCEDQYPAGTMCSPRA